MVLYDYEGPDGDRVERNFSMGKAPRTVSVKGVRYRRVFTAPRLTVSKPVTAYSLPDQRTMPKELQDHVDSWTSDGAPCFTSKASARRFGEESRRLCAAGKTDREWHFDSAPTAAEVRKAREDEVKRHRAEMLKRPRPKGLFLDD